MRRALALALLILPTTAPAQTPPQCGPRADVLATLAARYGEARQALGLAANSAVVELLANPETGSWTIIATLPSGISCLIASGEAYQALAEALIPGHDA
ncbi:MAG: hypothetical protein JXJ18_07900 [Rhodobacteraceae bacterium]|nr:hypothetical protein [Paracoccaceae bacterium]